MNSQARKNEEGDSKSYLPFSYDVWQQRKRWGNSRKTFFKKQRGKKNPRNNNEHRQQANSSVYINIQVFFIRGSTLPFPFFGKLSKLVEYDMMRLKYGILTSTPHFHPSTNPAPLLLFHPPAHIFYLNSSKKEARNITIALHFTNSLFLAHPCIHFNNLPQIAV